MKIAESIDVLPLLYEIHRQPQLWDRNDVRLSKNGPHWQTHDIWLRYKDETENKEKKDYANFGDPHDGVWYPSYYELPAARRIIFGLMSRVEGERIGGVLVYKIPPGRRIMPHTDTGWHVDYFDKFNVCLQSNPKAAFHYSESNFFRQKMGDIHRFVNGKEHWVVNDGDDDHIVLTVCIRVHDYNARFKSAA